MDWNWNIQKGVPFNVMKEKPKPKITVTSVSCFGGNYVCPYYGLSFYDEIKIRECNKCWGN